MANLTKPLPKWLSLLRLRFAKLRLKKQPKNCYILQLPIDVLQLIMENLPQYSQVFLSQTCTALRNLEQDTHGSKQVISDASRMEWLTVLNQDCVGKWVFEVCVKTHAVSLSDYPGWPLQRHHRASQELCMGPYLGRGLRIGSFHLAHRHVQLALKYSRMPRSQLNREQRNHLEWLMEERREYQRVGNHPLRVDIRYRMEPLAINGRFLLFVRETATPQDGDRDVPYWDIHACPHQAYYVEGQIRYIERRELTVQRRVARLIARRKIKPGNADAIKAAEEDRREKYVPGNASEWRMEYAAEHALRKPGLEILSGCGLCRTDFSLEIVRRKDRQGNPIPHTGVQEVTLKRWFDFGPECAPESLEWLAMTCGWRDSGIRHEFPHGLPIGSIQKTYREEQDRRGALLMSYYSASALNLPD